MDKYIDAAGKEVDKGIEWFNTPYETTNGVIWLFRISVILSLASSTLRIINVI